MYTIHKTRQGRNIYMILLPLAVLVVTALIGVAFGRRMAFIFLGAFFWAYAVYSLLTFVRTQNTGFIVVALFQVCAGIQTQLVFPTNLNQPQMEVGILLMACTFFLLVWVIILATSKKLKWRGRDILELAAAPVEDIGNGYTPRPLPAGKTDFTQRQIMEFDNFARRNLLAVSYVGKDKIVFVPVADGQEFPFILGLKGNYTDETWVAIDYSGNVSVNISHRNYMEYKESFAFDQLCASLANLFIEFITMHQRGEGVHIIDRLDAMNIPWHS